MVSSRLLRSSAFPFVIGSVMSCGGGAGDSTPTAPVAPVVATVSVAAPAGTLQVGQAYQFTAVAKDRNGTVLSDTQAPIFWSISPAAVATISAKGVVTPTAAGTVTVSATAGSVTGNATASFIQAPPALSADVFMAATIFIPFNTTVKVGGIVRFNFENGNPHNVIFAKIAGAPADILVTQSVVINRAFAAIGTFPFECKIHPGMMGQVTVVP